MYRPDLFQLMCGTMALWMGPIEAIQEPQLRRSFQCRIDCASVTSNSRHAQFQSVCPGYDAGHLLTRRGRIVANYTRETLSHDPMSAEATPD